MTEQLDPRDEAAIANAMLLGELISRQRTPDWAMREYAFIQPNPLPFNTKFYLSIDQAAWMFLCRLGYGIEPKGTGIVRLVGSNRVKVASPT